MRRIGTCHPEERRCKNEDGQEEVCFRASDKSPAVSMGSRHQFFRSRGGEKDLINYLLYPGEPASIAPFLQLVHREGGLVRE